MKTFFLLLSFLLASLISANPSRAQNAGTLSGIVLDDKGEPLSYGTVTLHKAADAALVTGEPINLEGKFSLKTPGAGKYFLRVSALGFSNHDLPLFSVAGPEFSKDFGKVSLKQDSKVLQEVKVEGMRPTIDMQADKMVVNVEGTAMAAGNNAYEVLSKSPGVFLDQDGNIQLNGKAGVQVMIDGKLTYLSGKQLQTLLQGMPAENVKNLEIIANPSAKYEAEGTSGIININLKKNTIAGMNGSLYGGYQFNKEHGFNGGGTMNVKRGKWNSFFTVDGSTGPRIRKVEMDRNFTNGGATTNLLMNANQFDQRNSQSARFGTDYDLTPMHSVGGTVSLARSSSDDQLATNTIVNSSAAPGRYQNITLNTMGHRFLNATTNLHYVGKLDTLGTNLSADVDVVTIIDNGTGKFISTPLGNNNPTTAYQLENDNPTGYQILSAKVDFTKPLPALEGKFESGVKASHVESDNKIDFYDVQDRTRTPNLDRTDHFIFDENIFSGYVTFHSKLSDKWSIQSGLRAEYTRSKGLSIPYKQTNNQDYLDFFPSVFLMQQVSENYQVTYNFSKRINRPRYSNLNPFVFIIDDNTEAQGNPYLKPQYTYSFQATQTIKKNYNVVMGYSQSKDAISEVPIPDVEKNKIVFQQRNVAYESLHMTVVAPFNVTSKWNFSNNLTVNYQNYTTVLPTQTVYNSKVMFYAQTNHNVKLPNNFKIETSAAYHGAGAFNVYKTKPSYWVDLGLKRSFMKDQLDITLTATDLFRTNRMQGTSMVGENTNAISMYRYSQGIRFNLRYRFNKGEKFESKKRNTSLDEVNRAGGN